MTRWDVLISLLGASRSLIGSLLDLVQLLLLLPPVSVKNDAILAELH